jgi:hypothetical protein
VTVLTNSVGTDSSTHLSGDGRKARVQPSISRTDRNGNASFVGLVVDAAIRDRAARCRWPAHDIGDHRPGRHKVAKRIVATLRR